MSSIRTQRFQAASLLAVVLFPVLSQGQIVQTYFVPIPDNQITTINTALYSSTGTNLQNIISIAPGFNNTVIVYDHWEDGYEDDITNPVQLTTQTWGDNNDSNGRPPGFLVDQIGSGDIVALLSQLGTPRDPSVVDFDGFDKFSVTKPVAVSRAAFNLTPGVVLAGAAEVLDSGSFGTIYVAPVGVDTVGGGNMFEITAFSVMAAFNNTVLDFDTDADGTTDQTQILNQGDSLLVQGLSEGATVTGTKPFQSHLITGDIANNYESRWLSLFPASEWDSSYYLPVDSAPSSNDDDTEVFFYNHGTNSITVFAETVSATGTIAVGAMTSARFTMPEDSGGHFFTTNNAMFTAFAVVDTGNGSGGNVHDWGLTLIPERALTPIALVGWGPGRDPNSSATNNVNPVWVIAVSNATIYVDYDGDPATGPLTDPLGNGYDTNYVVGPLEQVQVFDFSDGDQTGTRLYTLDATPIAAAWGQDPQTAPDSDPSLDMGTTVLPYPSIIARKDAILFVDVNTNNLVDPGDAIEYTIEVINEGFVTANNVIVLDELETNVTSYALGSTLLNGVPVLDESSPSTPYPIDEGGLNIGTLAVGVTSIVEYVVTVDIPFPEDVDAIVNEAFLDSSEGPGGGGVVTPVNIKKLNVSKSSSATQPLIAGETNTYTIVVTNVRTNQQTMIEVNDPLPPGVSWVPGSTVVTAPGPGPETNTVSDLFATSTYTNNDGNATWAGAWIEMDNAGAGPGAGDVVVANGQLEVSDDSDSGIFTSAERQVNLSGAVSATLSFDYSAGTGLETEDEAVVEVSSDGGSFYTILETFDGISGSENGSRTYDISSFMSANTRVRFRIVDEYHGGSERFGVDNLVISYGGRDQVAAPGNSPPALVAPGDAYELLGGEMMTITYSVVVDSPLSNGVTEIVNTACADSDEQLLARCDTVTNFLGMADVGVFKADGPDPTFAGSNLIYTIVATNVGPNDASGVRVTDLLPPELTVTNTVPSLGSYNTGSDIWDVGFLAVGGSETLVLETLVASSTQPGLLTNTVTISAGQIDSNPANDTNSVTTTILSESDLVVAKTDATDPVRIGDSIVYSVLVSNRGPSDASGVVVTDSVPVGISFVSAAESTGSYSSASRLWTIGGLAAGASELLMLTFTAEPGAVPFVTNAVAVSGNEPDPNPGDNTDTEVTEVQDPGIELIKSPPLQQFQTGGTATFTILVTNTGNVPLAGVTVTDALAPNCDAALGSLAPGASTSYVCVVTNVLADFTNSAIAVGTPPVGPDVMDSDDAVVDVSDASVQILKSPALQTIQSGSTAFFTITVTNSGNSDLTNVSVADALAPGCDAFFGSLSAGSSTSYNCSVTNVVAGFTNTANVVGQPPVGPPVGDSDDAVVDVINPSIGITKDPATQQIVSGSNAVFTITVTNSGDVALSNVTVTDALASNCDLVIGALGIGESTSYQCTAFSVVSDFTNTADVVGQPPVGPPVSDMDDAIVDVINPSIGITKDPATQQVVSGSNAVFTITVTNSGDVALSNVTVTDAQASNCDLVIGALGIGESTSYQCAAFSVVSDFTNTADVVGQPPVGPPVGDSDDAVVDVINPSIGITKDPATQQIVSGSNSVFTITVTNGGDVALSNVTVTDAQASSCDLVIGALGIGESTSYQCAAFSVVADFTNTADVVGQPPVGPPVSDMDDAVVDAISPSIGITKDPATQQIVGGSNAVFTITVTNSGDVALSNVTVTDALASNCDLVIGALGIGESTSYQCTAFSVVTDFTNTADVVGQPPVGPPVGDSDDAVVDVINPSIGITKDPATQQVVSGSNAVFTITVTNSGDVALSGVTVTDAQASNCDLVIGALGIGESTSYQCTAFSVVSDFTNTADVVGQPPVGPPVSDMDDAIVDVIGPSIRIFKSPVSQQIPSGSNAVFTITVTNSGDVALSNVTVSDAQASNCDLVIGALGIGESTSYQCTAFSVATDFTNTADVVGQPPVGPPVGDSDDAVVDVINPSIGITKDPATQQVVSGSNAVFTITVTNSGDVALSNVTVTDAQASNCDLVIGALGIGESTSYQCAAFSVVSDFTNTADVVGQPPVGPPVGDSDDAVVDVINPSIGITKDPAMQQIVSGSNAVFTITVTNSGDVALSNVTVTDVQASSCDLVIGALGIGESTSYQCTAFSVVTDFTNTADVVGQPPVGPPVGDSDDAVVDVINPSIAITKDPATQQIVSGSNAVFTITVTNSGDVALSNVTVTDAQASDCDLLIGALGIGESTSYQCTAFSVVSDFTNTADVVGQPPVGPPVGDSDDAVVDVINPSIGITKDPATQQVVSGSNAVFTITVTNSGDVALSNVTVTDAQASNCDLVIGALGIGESTSYQCTAFSVVTDFTNTADVVGQPPVGPPVGDSDDAVVDVINPSIAITKDPATQQIVSGSNAVFTITVTNSGDVALSNVTVTDAQASSCDLVIGALGIGESTSYQCTAFSVVSDFTNTADVVGQPPVGPPVSDMDDAIVDVIGPSIRIFKSPVSQQIPSGSNAVFTITVTNSGDVALSNVTVTDAQASDCDLLIGALGIGESTSYQCTAFSVVSDFTNTADVVGQPPVGPPVGDSDDAVVDVINPSIGITKDPATQQIVSGSDASFTITVTNNGDVALSGVQVTDVLALDCDLLIGTLGIGESTSYQCTASSVLSGFTNTADVVGQPPVGPPVGDSDDSVVTVIFPSIVSCAPDISVECFSDIPAPNPGSIVTMDFCDTNVNLVVSSTNDNGAAGCAGSARIVEYVYEASDSCGNSVLCTQTITVTDTTAPTLMVQSNLTLQGDSACEASVPAIVYTAIDNCDTNVTVIQAPLAGATLPGPGVFVVTVTAVDSCGNQTNETVEITVECDAALGGLVWEDTDFDGIQDPGESGVYHVLVELFDAGGFVLASTMTDTNGLYMFTSRDPGDYFIRFHPPGGYAVSPRLQGGDTTVDSDPDPDTGDTGVVTLAPNEINDTLDMGILMPRIDVTVTPMCISDAAYVDYEIVPVGFAPTGDTLIAWRTLAGDVVEVVTNQALSGQLVWPGTEFDSGGVVTNWPGWELVGEDWVEVDDGLRPVINLDFSLNPTSTVQVTYPDATAACNANPSARIGDFVWVDDDGDGIQDPGEPPVVGATVNLISMDAAPTVVDTTTTDANGEYSFPVGIGSYVVEFVPPPGHRITLQDVGSDEGEDSDADPVTGRSMPIIVSSGMNGNGGGNGGQVSSIVLPIGGTDLRIDAGLLAPVSIGQFVWHDMNANGVIDEDLSTLGINGVTVDLFLDDGTNLTFVGSAVSMTSTNGDMGFYVFTNLFAGSYVAVVDESTVPPRFVTATTPLQVISVLAPGEVDVTANFGFVTAPTAIELALFEAVHGEDGVEVTWITAVEIETLGFNVYRSGTEDDDPVLVNTGIVPAKGSSFGGVYEVVDSEADPEWAYFYWLEEIDWSFISTFYGPAVAEPEGAP